MESVHDEAPSLSYDTPPTAYALVGNHDCFDGLSCFLRFVVFAKRLGGWRLPQKKTYFCLKLPCSWFVFCLDAGLQADIDFHQCRYFSRLAKRLVRSDPRAKFILCQHDPRWVNDNYERRSEHSMYAERYLDVLLRALGTRLKLRVAGDIHHYSRHEPASGKKGPMLVISGGGTCHSCGVRCVCAHVSAFPFAPSISLTDTHTTFILLRIFQGGAFLHPTHVDDLGAADFTYLPSNGTAQSAAAACQRHGEGVQYTRAEAFPSPQTSATLGWQNVWKFRSRNL